MKLGRNDPCHCGSGRKYKHCHYNEDRAAEAQALKEAAEAAAQDAKNSDGADTDSDAKAAPDKAAAERAAATGRRDHSGSRFMRNPPSGGSAKSGGKGPGAAPRATRGAQRGS